MRLILVLSVLISGFMANAESLGNWTYSDGSGRMSMYLHEVTGKTPVLYVEDSNETKQYTYESEDLGFVNETPNSEGQNRKYSIILGQDKASAFYRSFDGAGKLLFSNVLRKVDSACKR